MHPDDARPAGRDGADPRPAAEPAGEADAARLVAFACDLARAGETSLLADFLDGGYPANLPDEAGNTVLMLAAYHGHAETVRMLLRRGADVDRPNARGQTPVAGAIFKGEDDVVRALVGAGADLDVGTPSGRATAAMFGREDLLAHP